jgi:hypothetical protein
MSYNFRDLAGRNRASAPSDEPVPSGSGAQQPFEDDPNNLFAGTGPHDTSHLHEDDIPGSPSPVRSPIPNVPNVPNSPLIQQIFTGALTPIPQTSRHHQTPPHMTSTPNPTARRALPSPPQQIPPPIPPNRPVPSAAAPHPFIIPNWPPQFAPNPPQFVPPVQPAAQPAIPPAPAGIDPAIWAHNQALIMSLLPALMAMQQPAPAPAPHVPSSREGDAKAPTPFNGEDHSKLRDFIFECGLIFEVKPHTYASEKSRVMYAIQHLEGTAKRHFRRYIEARSNDPKINRWRDFVQELETIFGDPDRQGKASDKLLGLKMKENGKVHHYTVTFKEAADELGWPETVLHRLYYNGLPNRIKDLWARSDPPADFNDLVREAQRADIRYWKRVDEKKSESAPTPTSNTKGKQAPSSSNPKSSSSSQPQSHSSSKTNPTQSSSASTSKPKTKDISNIIGPDGKLLPEEKARREKLGLCTYCGEKHSTEECPKRPAKSSEQESTPKPSTSSPKKQTSGNASGSKPKGRVAQIVEVAEESEQDDDSAENSDF